MRLIFNVLFISVKSGPHEESQIVCGAVDMTRLAAL